jgi:hypothetical protein
MGAGGFMRIDWYTKGVLTVIAVLLAVIALRPYVSPGAVAHAQGSLAGVQIWYGDVASPKFFDARTGDVWDTQPENSSLSIGLPVLARRWSKKNKKPGNLFRRPGFLLLLCPDYSARVSSGPVSLNPPV